MHIVRIGVDLAKYVFEIHGVDAHGKTAVRKTLRRHAVSTFFANLPPCLIGMEASNGAHFWAKALSDLGHDVRLISPQFVGSNPLRSTRKSAQTGVISAATE
jgi:transposase